MTQPDPASIAPTGPARSGRCECGAVAFTAAKARPTLNICHCTQCRRMGGHLWAATRVMIEDLTFTSDDTLTWFASSDTARRGFCSKCGSSLFYHGKDAPHYGVSAGSFDAPTGFTIGQHIFAADKGDYYEITGDAPVKDAY
ncbi:GFA family protein [Alphaproteobacteria bacterium KMM 3653]|uniref:GFA family protein n=1 Tax=Harenicola maris TaxID=2841044 RepID=A0AAP2G6W9_9RHOB|nr:GFA family protein [Harenicola maris]